MSAIWSSAWDEQVRFNTVDFEFRRCNSATGIGIFIPPSLTGETQDFDDNGWPLTRIAVPNAKTVVHFTQVDAKFAGGGNVSIAACDFARPITIAPWDAPAVTPKAGDIMVLDGQCAMLTVRLTRSDGDCNDVHVFANVSLIGDFCNRSPSAEVCTRGSYDANATRPPFTTAHTMRTTQPPALTTLPPSATAKSTAARSSRSAVLTTLAGIALTTIAAVVSL